MILKYVPELSNLGLSGYKKLARYWNWHSSLHRRLASSTVLGSKGSGHSLLIYSLLVVALLISILYNAYILPFYFYIKPSGPLRRLLDDLYIIPF